MVTKFYPSKPMRRPSAESDIKREARVALTKLLNPLLGFILDSGLSVKDIQLLIHDAAVLCAAENQLMSARRVNISGIAASTGISRAEISRILRKDAHARFRFDRHHLATNRVLAAWHEDPLYTSQVGRPLDLKIYGTTQSFERIVKKHGKGIPTRAILDELIRGGAAEVLDGSVVRAKSDTVIYRGTNPRAVRMFGDRTYELLATMLANMRSPEAPRFVASVAESNLVTGRLPLVRKELSQKGASFLSDIQELLTRETSPPTRQAKKSAGKKQVSVTLFYFESSDESHQQRRDLIKRRNFRRTSSSL